MSLYPTTVVPLADALAATMMALANGSVIAIPLILAPGRALEVTVLHVAPTQDHSIRCCISDRVGGAPLPAPFSAQYWHANRIPTERVVLTSFGFVPDTQYPLIEVFAGEYFLNLHNLANSENVFSLMINEL